MKTNNLEIKKREKGLIKLIKYNESKQFRKRIAITQVEKMKFC